MALDRDGAWLRRALLGACRLMTSATVAGPVAMGSFWCGCDAFAVLSVGCRRPEVDVERLAAECVAEIEQYLAANAQSRGPDELL
jgi:hypothetical protein